MRFKHLDGFNLRPELLEKFAVIDKFSTCSVKVSSTGKELVKNKVCHVFKELSLLEPNEVTGLVRKYLIEKEGILKQPRFVCTWHEGYLLYHSTLYSLSQEFASHPSNYFRHPKDSSLCIT